LRGEKTVIRGHLQERPHGPLTEIRKQQAKMPDRVKSLNNNPEKERRL